MTNLQRKAFKTYRTWCDEGNPPVDPRAGHAFLLAIGFLVNVTDGSPDHHESALFRVLTDAYRRHESEPAL